MPLKNAHRSWLSAESTVVAVDLTDERVELCFSFRATSRVQFTFTKALKQDGNLKWKMTSVISSFITSGVENSWCSPAVGRQGNGLHPGNCRGPCKPANTYLEMWREIIFSTHDSTCCLKLTAKYVATAGLHFILDVIEAHGALVLLIVSSPRLNCNRKQAAIKIYC